MMESGDVYRAASSSGSRRGSAGNGLEVFPRSSREEYDDEEDLRWAALQKLPTFDRLRKGILVTGTDGSHEEVDILSIGMCERRFLLDRLVKDADEDNEKFLLKLKDRIDRVGINLPTIEVRYEHLSVETEAHVGGRALPTFINFILNMFEDDSAPRSSKLREDHSPFGLGWKAWQAIEGTRASGQIFNWPNLPPSI
ncbi:hypothetical protein SAY87_008478 [Trapa incisa]|uniref:Pleiotropic ABC efflux transporter N-terminal domain-containing protein n=1 Tax=Trapa incisa TaxID=236973 RepID=A0AAN7KMM9_9MYRT|nr:hypothetical protein SAY87_008478 [Trapa incisa]